MNLNAGLKSIALLIILVVLFLVSGIAGCEKKTDTGEIEGIFIGGTDGIEAGFAEEKPKDIIYEGEPFDITISLKNKGEFSSKKIIASLSGLNKESFNLISLDKQLISEELDGRNIEQPDVIEEDEISFSANYGIDLKADYKSTIKADVCYSYGTYAIADVCLKRDVYDRETDGVCNVPEVLEYESSSAPVQITGVTTVPDAKNKIKLSFTIENKGSGEVYSNDAFEDSCRGKIDKKDKILINVDTTTLVPIKCSGFGDKKQAEVSLTNGRRTIHCTIDTSELQDTAFSERVNINAYYFYRISPKKEIIIKA